MSAWACPIFAPPSAPFSSCTQVAGRAGRGSLPGIVLIQTINPDHYAVRMAAAQDYQAFYEKELNFRRMMHYPPFSAMANILVRSEKKEMALRMSRGPGPAAHAAAREAAHPGPGRSPRAAPEERVPLSVPHQSRQPQGAQRDHCSRSAASPLDRKWNATALVIDVDPLTLM